MISRCPLCKGTGCEECDNTGTRYNEGWVSDDGMTLHVHGSGPGFDTETRQAFEAIARAALARVAEREAKESARTWKPAPTRAGRSTVCSNKYGGPSASTRL